MIHTNKQEHIISVICDKCSTFEDYCLDEDLPCIIDNLLLRGWEITNNFKTYICPDCANYDIGLFPSEDKLKHIKDFYYKNYY